MLWTPASRESRTTKSYAGSDVTGEVMQAVEAFLQKRA